MSRACNASAPPSRRMSSRPITTTARSASRLNAEATRSSSSSAAVPTMTATGPAAMTRRARATALTGTTRSESLASRTRACSAALSACSVVGVTTTHAGAVPSCSPRLRSSPGRIAAAIMRRSAGPCSTTCWLRVAPAPGVSRSCSPTSRSLSVVCQPDRPTVGVLHAHTAAWCVAPAIRRRLVCECPAPAPAT